MTKEKYRVFSEREDHGQKSKAKDKQLASRLIAAFSV